ncbi:NACHT domain-containing protein [Streptomyces noursei]|uniref:NACHT domain-containing protein n=1 Tax=Streptomyces noursei TaxID=1971 RepID=UPI0035D62794
MSIAAAVVFAVWNIVFDEKPKAVDVATLLGVPIGVTGLVIAIVALRKQADTGSAELARKSAAKLAKRIRDSDGAVRRQLLGDDTQRINLAYVLHSAAERAATAPPAGHTFADGPAALPDVLDYYRATRPRRLVITGAAGAGKTVLALELMDALIEGRSEGDPVPVRIPLAQWNTDQPLTTLLVQRLTDAYRWPAAAAAGLVGHGMVLPVLDGLDEMDPLRADGTPDPEAPRARAALEALNAYQDGREAGPLVLTCRTGHYDALPPASRLIDAARVAIAPIDTRNTIAYLRSRARDRARWQPLTDHLGTHPSGPLATTLSTPWRLCLTATVYHRDGNPAELLHHTSGHDLDQHLLARYLPAATANTRNPHRYQPEDVHRWLHHLTTHLTGTGARAPATDLTLHRLWPLAGSTRVRITDLLLTMLLAAVLSLSLPLSLSLLFFLDPPLREAPVSFPIFGAFIFFPDLPWKEDLVFFPPIGAFIGALAFRPTPKPNRLRMDWGTLQGGFMARFWSGFKRWFIVGSVVGFSMACAASLKRNDVDTITLAILMNRIAAVITMGIVIGLIGGFMGGLSGGFTDGFNAWFQIWFMVGFVLSIGISLGHEYGPPGFIPKPVSDDRLSVEPNAGLMLGIIFGSMGGLAGGFMRGLKAEPTTVANPREIVRDDMSYGLLIGPLAGLSVALPLVPLIEPLGALSLGFVFGLVVGLAGGLGCSARRYGAFLLCSRGKLPFRLDVFLDWAVTAGLLRYNGPSYQFRHRELQHWLSQHPAPERS